MTARILQFRPAQPDAKPEAPEATPEPSPEYEPEAPQAAPEPAAPDAEYLDRAAAIARIRAALKKRSGKAWSVTGGSGTAWGWIKVDAPPARRTWRQREGSAKDAHGYPIYEDYDSGKPGGSLSPSDRAELSALLGLATVHHQGESIPSGGDYYREYVDRAEGRKPSKVGAPYWD